MSYEYARQVAATAVSQMADIAGFESAHGNALNAAADVMMRFITEIGMYAKEAAELEGRTDVNVLDVVRCPLVTLICDTPHGLGS